MILYLDDEKESVGCYRQQLALLGEVKSVYSADEALLLFQNQKFIQKLRLAVIHLGVCTSRDVSEQATGFGRLTGYALRQELHKVWRGPVIFLSNFSDVLIETKIQEEGDYFFRKPHTTPMQLHCIALGILNKKQ